MAADREVLLRLSERTSPSAVRVLEALAKGEATYMELLRRVRPMSQHGLTTAVYQLMGHRLVHLAEDGYARITEAGKEALGV